MLTESFDAALIGIGVFSASMGAGVLLGRSTKRNGVQGASIDYVEMGKAIGISITAVIQETRQRFEEKMGERVQALEHRAVLCPQTHARVDERHNAEVEARKDGEAIMQGELQRHTDLIADINRQFSSLKRL